MRSAAEAARPPSPNPRIGEHVRDILTEMINIGVGRASSSLSELLGMHITLTVPEVYLYNYEEIRAYLGGQKGQYVEVVQGLRGGLNGAGVLSFPIVNGKTLVDVLLSGAGGGGDWGEGFGVVESEAIQEVGNIVVNAVGSVVSDLTGLAIEYDLPAIRIREGMGDLDFMGPRADLVFCYCTTLFAVRGINVEGNINLLFGYRDVEAIESALGRTA